MKLAIVIPYFKKTYFLECLLSLKNQTIKNFNVYIGNDASPDNPEGIIEDFKDYLNITYKRFDSNFGGISLTKQWERCIEMTNNEEWLMILGDDDVLGENIVKDFYHNYPKFSNNTNVIRFASQVINSEGKAKSLVYKHPKWERASDSFLRWLNGKTRSSLSEHIFTKKTYIKYKFKNYPLGWHSDDIAWLNFPDRKEIFSINKSTVYIRHSGHNITSAQNNLDQKEKATVQFQNDLIFENLKIFSKSQRKRLLLNYEIFKKQRKDMRVQDWRSILFLYYHNGNFYEILKLIRRFFMYHQKG